jgi:hypothetical protein
MVPGMRWWKVAGLAGLAGVAASGVVVARAQRQRNAYTPDEVRDRLRARAAEAGVEPAGAERPAGGSHGKVGE